MYKNECIIMFVNDYRSRLRNAWARTGTPYSPSVTIAIPLSCLVMLARLGYCQSRQTIFFKLPVRSLRFSLILVSTILMLHINTHKTSEGIISADNRSIFETLYILHSK
uniref:AlNc14C25G2493 protein n=1 Tax=Albugo laibachii Nc14 TaxID=890382 RepID=F0W6K4_9STRA|nr:AlNc14C25G2493 [Albugo laibachii Nc14]CCA27448.1 AlNc14C536G12089 [Albugo laibachii Nc14]|eukprot:CCA27448.1 AlNc14C536G12089 [Albugo laibachii Nc14]